MLTVPVTHNRSVFSHISFLRETLPRQEGNHLIVVLRGREHLSSVPLQTIYRGNMGAGALGVKNLSQMKTVQRRKMGGRQMAVWCGERDFQKRGAPRVQVHRGGLAEGSV